MREGMQECRHFGIVWIVVNLSQYYLTPPHITESHWIAFDSVECIIQGRLVGTGSLDKGLKMGIILSQGVPQGKQGVFQPENLHPKT